MSILRRFLYYSAALWAVCGLGVAIVPHWVLVGIFKQVEYPDYAYVRVTGAMSIGLALLMVLVAQRLDELWWFSWAFALTGAAIVTITTLHALFGVPQGSSSVLWWLFAGVNAVLTAGVLVGMAMAGQEKPFA